MVHPNFDILTEFLKTGKPATIADHLEECEQCSGIVEGIKIAMASSEKKGIELDQLLQESRERTLESIQKEKEFDNNVTVGPRSWWRLAAASVVFVIGAVYYFSSVRFDASDFVAQQIALDRPMPNSERNMMTAASEEWTLFVTNYNKGNYANALAYIDKIEGEQKNSRIDFFTGLCYLYLDPVQYDLASAFLSKVVNSESRFKEQAAWYLALCYYQSNKLDLAEEVLLEISTLKDHFKEQEAKRLLESIR